MACKTFSWSRIDITKATQIMSGGAGARARAVLMSVTLTLKCNPFPNPDDCHLSGHLVTHPFPRLHHSLQPYHFVLGLTRKSIGVVFALLVPLSLILIHRP